MKSAPNRRLTVPRAAFIALALLSARAEAAAPAPAAPSDAPATLRAADNPLAKPGGRVPVPTIVWDKIQVRRDHPRLLFNKETLPAFRDWFASHPINKVIGEAASKQHDPLAMALLYQMTGDEPQARGAIKKLLDGSAAEVNAYIYDWTYDAMTDSDREQATRILVAGVRVDRASGWPRVSPYSAYPEDPRPSETPPDQWRPFYNWTFHDQDWARRYVMYGYLDRMIALAHHAPRMEESVRNYWEYSLKDVTLYYDYLADGSYYQGDYWHVQDRIEDIIRIFWTMRTATGVDYLDPKAHPYLAHFGRWLLYGSDPTLKRMIWRYGDAFQCLMPRSALLATNRLARDPYVSWLTLQVAPTQGHWLTELVFHDPTVAPKSPDADLPPARAFPGNGLAVMRSGWGPDDPVAMVQFSDWWDVHQHSDTGSFVLYCRSPLAPDSGRYCASTAAFHATHYSQRTMAHNTITIRDPAAQKPLNDGNQREKTQRTWSFAVGKAAWVYHQDFFDRGDLLAFETHDLYDYCAGDATRAYPPEDLKEFRRQAVYLRDGVFVVFDRVETPRPNLEKRWLLHLVGKPKINGRITRTEVKDHIEDYDGTLVVSEGSKGAVLRSHTLLPTKPLLRMVGGAIPDVPPARLVRVPRSQHRMGTGDRWSWTDPLILSYDDPITGKPRPAIAIERNSPTNTEYEVTDTQLYLKLDAYERGLVQEFRYNFADYPTLLDLVRKMNLDGLWHAFANYLPGYQFYNEGMNYAPAYSTHEWSNLSELGSEMLGKPSDLGMWRVEVYPTQPATRDYFLHVMRVLPKADDEPGEVAGKETPDRAEATVTLRGKTYTIAFAKTGAVGGHIRIADSAGKVLADSDFVQKIEQKP
jgi:hypothetical protein